METFVAFRLPMEHHAVKQVFVFYRKWTKTSFSYT